MYCNNCGKFIEDDSLFCKYCGENVNADDKEDDTVKTLNNKQPSMRWFKFLVKYLMPIWLILGTLSRFRSISLTVDNYYNSDWKYFMVDSIDAIPNTIVMILNIFITIFLYVTWKELKSFTKQGYKLSIAFFALTILTPAILMIIYLPLYISANVGYDFYNMFVNIGSALIICVPNIIYLKKRKSLFLENGYKDVKESFYKKRGVL